MRSICRFWMHGDNWSVRFWRGRWYLWGDTWERRCYLIMSPMRRSYTAFSKPCCSFCSLLRCFHLHSASLISKVVCYPRSRLGLQAAAGWQPPMAAEDGGGTAMLHSLLLGYLGVGWAVKLPHKYSAAPCWSIGSKWNVSSFLLQCNVQQVVIIFLFHFWFCFR